MLAHTPEAGARFFFTIQDELVEQEHPETAERLTTVYRELVEQGLADRARWIPASTASPADLELVHDAQLVRNVTASYASDAAAADVLGLDPDTYFIAGRSGHACSLAAGSVVELATRVAVTGELRNALACVRPPGHHAERERPMGFCLLNNVAVAAAALRTRHGLSRVLIVDWDVHHGNGVQHIFEEDASVLYVSLHRYGGGFYPGTGAPDEVGLAAGAGYTVNVAWSEAGMGDAEYLAAFERLVLPIAREFEPQVVLVSAGFDAAAGDPLGGGEVTPAGFAQLTHLLSSLAGGRLVLALEGGYNLEANAACAAACMRVLLGEPPPALPALLGPPRTAAQSDLEVVRSVHAPYWRCMNERRFTF